MNSIASGRGEADVGRATAAGTSSIGIRPWKRQPVAPPRARRPERLQALLGVAAAVDVEARIAGRAARAARPGDRPDRDVDLIGGREAARVDRAAASHRRGTAGVAMGRRVEPRERWAVDDDRDLVRPDAEAEQPVAHRRR